MFADALYWIALANPRDQWYSAARALDAELSLVQIFTTDEVLTEVLANLSSAGKHRRLQAVEMVLAILDSPNITVIHQSHTTFIAGLILYLKRPDKHYSLTDCISMNTCQAEGISEVLTNDHHFEQEGFVTLLK